MCCCSVVWGFGPALLSGMARCCPARGMTHSVGDDGRCVCALRLEHGGAVQAGHSGDPSLNRFSRRQGPVTEQVSRRREHWPAGWYAT